MPHIGRDMKTDTVSAKEAAILKALLTGKFKDYDHDKATLKRMHREGLLSWERGVFGYDWQISVTGRDIITEQIRAEELAADSKLIFG